MSLSSIKPFFGNSINFKLEKVLNSLSNNQFTQIFFVPSKKVNFYKPESSRDESKETYLHCAFLNPL